MENFEIDESVEIEQMPWMVSLGTYKSANQWGHQCGGSLVTNRHVLTAAHCFTNLDPDNLETSGYKMRLGTSDLWNAHDGIERKVVAIYVHPQYAESRAYFDVGVAVAERVIEYTNTVMPICLPMRPVDDEDALSGDYVNLAGWGLQYDPSTKLYEITSKMKLASLQVNSRDVCEKIFSEDSIKAAGLPLIQLRKQIPAGFTNDISCVGNDFSTAEVCRSLFFWYSESALISSRDLVMEIPEAQLSRGSQAQPEKGHSMSNILLSPQALIASSKQPFTQG